MSSVYDINRIKPAPPPRGFKDDLDDINFVPAPCQVACPVGTDAPSYIAYIWEGRLHEAFEAITATNPFSSICGRVCDAPCEPACRRTDSDGPVAIRNLKRYVMDRLGKDYRPEPVTVRQQQTIGIVGAGPAGMTAAQGLAEAGYAVHVYEMTDRPGGMMAWGIPAFRLPPGIIAEDTDRLLARCPGIKMHLNRELGKDITLAQLKADHDAVLLTIGAWWGKHMEIPGDHDSRVVDGVGFLRRINAGERPRLPETVLVVGGGDVAMDACRVARRLPGCKRVKVIYRRGPEEIPARRDELEGAVREGIDIVYNIQPVAIAAEGGGFALRCVHTRPGDPDPGDGRRRPVNVKGSEHDIDCGMVIMAVGQQAQSSELDEAGLMAADRIQTDFSSMRTADEKVFAAGDGAFGGSTIVMAMHHGQRAAYYIQAYLQGRHTPLPYRTPYRTRRVPVAQDPEWEVIPRQEQPFHGLGAVPVAFPEIETTYDARSAKAEAARCYRCDAETGSADYSVQSREDIFVMARTQAQDLATQRAILDKRLAGRSNPFPQDRPATLDDLVFLPANLSRLVIDPYREACRVETRLRGGLNLAAPLLAAGFDQAPQSVRRPLAAALRAQGIAYLGTRPLGQDVTWLQLISGESNPSADAAALVYCLENGKLPASATRKSSHQGLGLAVGTEHLVTVIPLALQGGFDMLVLDASAGLAAPWAELHGQPDLRVVREAIHILRRLNREEDLDLIFYGGVRSGTDAAKLIALGCNAVVLSAAIGFALGGQLTKGGIEFYADHGDEDREHSAVNLLKATTGEASMMARCTGKTDVHNLEPEDLRAITIATARDTGIPLAGTQWTPEPEAGH